MPLPFSSLTAQGIDAVDAWVGDAVILAALHAHTQTSTAAEAQAVSAVAGSRMQALLWQQTSSHLLNEAHLALAHTGTAVHVAHVAVGRAFPVWGVFSVQKSRNPAVTPGFVHNTFSVRKSALSLLIGVWTPQARGFRSRERLNSCSQLPEMRLDSDTDTPACFCAAQLNN